MGLTFNDFLFLMQVSNFFFFFFFPSPRFLGLAFYFTGALVNGFNGISFCVACSSHILEKKSQLPNVFVPSCL